MGKPVMIQSMFYSINIGYFPGLLPDALADKEECSDTALDQNTVPQKRGHGEW